MKNKKDKIKALIKKKKNKLLLWFFFLKWMKTDQSKNKKIRIIFVSNLKKSIKKERGTNFTKKKLFK